MRTFSQTSAGASWARCCSTSDPALQVADASGGLLGRRRSPHRGDRRRQFNSVELADEVQCVLEVVGVGTVELDILPRARMVEAQVHGMKPLPFEAQPT